MKAPLLISWFFALVSVACLNAAWSAENKHDAADFMELCEDAGGNWRLQAAACLILTTLTEDRDDLARTFYNRGNALEEVGEYQDAIADYGRSLEHRSDFIGAIVNRGLTYRRMGRHDLALADYDRALAMDPEHQIARINRGYLFIQQEEYSAAIADFDLVLASDPGNAFALNNRALAYWESGEPERALADFATSLEFHPDTPLVLFNRGLLLSELGKLDLAIKDYSAVLRVDSSHVDARVNLADILAFAGEKYRNLEAALAHKMMIVAARPDDVDQRYDLAVILTWLGKPELAIAEHRKIADEAGYAPEYQRRLAEKGYLEREDANGTWNTRSQAALEACVRKGCLPLEE